MIAYLEGNLAYKDPGQAIIDVGGVGYQVKISLGTFAWLQQAGTGKLRLHTWLQVKEDGHTLFGFSTAEEKALFLHLISVSGIGPGTAIMMLSGLDAQDLKHAIISGNVRAVQAIKGVGPKTAQRIILELQDKLLKDGLPQDMPAITLSTANNSARTEALQALTTLGIARPAAEKLVDALLKQDPAMRVEDLIRKALKTA